jgi:phage gp45-like
MTQLGTVTGQEIKTNRNGEIDVRLLQVQFSNDRDIQTVQHFNPSGEDSGPINGDEVIVFDLGPAFKVAVSTQDALAAVVGAGEKKLYSRDSAGAIKAFINLLANGNVQVNGATDTAVRFAALNTALQGLVTAINAVLAGKQDGSGAAGTLTLDLSAAESDTVELA